MCHLFSINVAWLQKTYTLLSRPPAQGLVTTLETSPPEARVQSDVYYEPLWLETERPLMHADKRASSQMAGSSVQRWVGRGHGEVERCLELLDQAGVYIFTPPFHILHRQPWGLRRISREDCYRGQAPLTRAVHDFVKRACLFITARHAFKAVHFPQSVIHWHCILCGTTSVNWTPMTHLTVPSSQISYDDL